MPHVPWTLFVTQKIKLWRNMNDLYLGLDGGQSSTTALIANASGTVLGRGSGGPCNHITGPAARQKFIQAIGDCLKQACLEAWISAEPVKFRAACLGFSGGSEDKEPYARELIKSEFWRITHDADIALSGATAGQPGIMVIAGTGSMAFGRNALGETARAGGWGYLFGDEGGALYIVREALRACLRHEEGWGPSTLLTNLLLAETRSSSINQLLHSCYGMPRSQIAGYARLVHKAAQEGDETALRVFDNAGKRLAEYVGGVHRNIFGGANSCAVSYIGGAFQSEHLLQAYGFEIERRLAIAIAPPQMPPAAGALLEAFRISNSPVPTEELAARLSASQTK